MKERRPFIVVPKPRSGWPSRTQVVGDQSYHALGGEIYAPKDPTCDEIRQMYAYWSSADRHPYDEQNAWIRGVGQRCGSLIMDHFGSQMRGRFVLDIAMGTGLVSQGLGDVLPQPVCHIGFDITQEMLDLARAKPSLSAHRMCRADVRSMPFRLNTFDVAVGSLFATPVERIAMFTDLKRILRKNGVLIIIDTPNNPDTPGITAELEEVFPGKQRKLQYTHVSQNAPGGFPLNYYLAVNDGAA